MEDYNTATLPHKKYYDYRAWEQKEYHKKLKKAARKSKARSERTTFDDERLVKKEIDTMVEDAFSGSDVNDDGKLSFDEFKRWLLNTPEVCFCTLPHSH